MQLLSTVYFRSDATGGIKKDDVGKIIGEQDSLGYYSVLLTKNHQVYRVHPHGITTSKPTPKSNVFQSLEEPFSSMSISSRTRSKSRSGPLTSVPSGRQTIEDIRAAVLRQKDEEQRQLVEIRQQLDNMSQALGRSSSGTKTSLQQNNLRSDTSIKTDNIPLVSHAHGRQRRSERNIQRKELQAAIKYGQKETANPGRDGSTRWRYTYNGVVFVTDETSRHEVTSWRIDGDDKESDVVAEAEVQLAGSKCHAVLIVDHSGSMRTPDVPGYKSRAHAVYECLKRDFVKEQLKSGTATDVVVTVISMSNTATVLLHKKPLDESLINDLQRLSNRKPKSHGNYIPALDKALEVMRADAENASSLLLLFFSDGAPSDQTNMKCVHGINIFDINRKIDPKMGHKSKGLAWKCVHGIASSVEDQCCQRVKSIGKIFGPDKVIFRTLAFGPPTENFTLLEKMANELPRGEFQKLGLNAANLKTSFSSLSSSLSTLRTEGGQRALTRRSDKVVDKNQKVDNSRSVIDGADGWWIYAFSDFINKYEFKKDMLRRVSLDGAANGIAFLQQPFAEGAERFVYRCTEIISTPYDYDFPASSDNVAGRCGLRLVSKEAKDLENHHQGRKFHETFARIQADAGDLAKSFTRLLPGQRPEWNLNFIKTHIYGCYDDSYKDGEAWILVEPELDGKFTKWNNNAGEIRGQTSAQGNLANGGGMGFLEELEESDEEGEGTVPIQVDDVPQAFSHFSYEHSKGKKLVCDLQGVWNADDGFVLTDPVIHYVCSRGRKHTNGATDKGEAGMKKFFATHVCNSLRKRMGLPKRTPAKLIKQ